MFGKSKRITAYNKSGKLPFADMDGQDLHEGDYIESFRYALGYCRILLTSEGYVYESLENGKRVHWARRTDGHTNPQKLVKLLQNEKDI